MRMRSLGKDGPLVSAIGLGCMAMSGSYGASSDDESIGTILAALDEGVTLVDTGDFYGMGHNELLLREAIWERSRERVFLSVKFGVQAGPDRKLLGIDCRPSAVKSSLAYTLRRLGTDYVDLYQPARLDPDVPIEDTVGAIAELIQAGYVRHLGLSEVGADTLRRAHAVHPVSAVQMEYSLMSRTVERSVLTAARELGVSLVAYGVLSRGLMGGSVANTRRPPIDNRLHYPRFQGDNLERNLAIVEALHSLAQARGVTVAQLAIAWVLSRGDDVIALVGARRRAQLLHAVQAEELTLSAGELEALEAAVPVGAVAGDRYPSAQMTRLDSERV